MDELLGLAKRLRAAAGLTVSIPPLLNEAADALAQAHANISAQEDRRIELATQLATALNDLGQANDRIAGSVEAMAEQHEINAQLRAELAAERDRFAVSECDKIMAMTDDQISALCAFQGHHPADEAALARQACELAVLINRAEAAERRADEATRVLSPLLADVMRCSAWHWFQNQDSVKAARAFLNAAKKEG